MITAELPFGTSIHRKSTFTRAQKRGNWSGIRVGRISAINHNMQYQCTNVLFTFQSSVLGSLSITIRHTYNPILLFCVFTSSLRNHLHGAIVFVKGIDSYISTACFFHSFIYDLQFMNKHSDCCAFNTDLIYFSSNTWIKTGSLQITEKISWLQRTSVRVFVLWKREFWFTGRPAGGSTPPDTAWPQYWSRSHSCAPRKSTQEQWNVGTLVVWEATTK